MEFANTEKLHEGLKEFEKSLYEGNWTTVKVICLGLELGQPEKLE